MRNKLDIREYAKILTTVAHYEELVYAFAQLDNNQPTVKAFWQKMSGNGNTSAERNSFYDAWGKFNLYVFGQMWSNTSGGWQTWGGSAMTQQFTIVLENKTLGFVAVYYDGKIAYVAEIDDNLVPFRSNCYNNLPGMHECDKKLTIVYKNMHP